MAAYLFLFLCFLQDPIIIAEPTPEPHILKAKTEVGDLQIIVNSPIVYLQKTGEIRLLDFIATGKLVKDGKELEMVSDYYKVDPKPIRPKFAVSDAYKFESLGSHTQLIIDTDGKIDLKFQFGTQTIHAPIEVKRLPIECGERKDVVVDAIGLPDDMSTHFVRWPEDKWFNGVFYTVEASESIRKIEQWRFKKLPYLTVSIENDKVVSIDSVAERDDSLRFPERFQKQLEKLLNNEEMSEEAGEKKNAEPKLSDFHEWQDIKGNKVRAKFLKFLDQKVYLQVNEFSDDPRNNVLILRINQLTKESADLARKLNAQAKKKKP